MEGPKYLYKYVTSSVAHLVLQNRTLRWSTASFLNDPFDIQFDLHVDVDREKYALSRWRSPGTLGSVLTTFRTPSVRWVHSSNRSAHSEGRCPAMNSIGRGTVFRIAV